MLAMQHVCPLTNYTTNCLVFTAANEDAVPPQPTARNTKLGNTRHRRSVNAKPRLIDALYGFKHTSVLKATVPFDVHSKYGICELEAPGSTASGP